MISFQGYVLAHGGKIHSLRVPRSEGGTALKETIAKRNFSHTGFFSHAAHFTPPTALPRESCH